LNFENVTVRRNVVSTIGRRIRVGNDDVRQSFGLSLSSLKGAKIEKNYFIHKPYMAGHAALIFDDGRPNKDAVVRGNVVHKWAYDNNKRSVIHMGKGVEGKWNNVELKGKRYVDAKRDPARYHGWIGRKAGLGALVKQARRQRREFWRPAYEAKNIVPYIREGFTLMPSYD
ncbi:MAG: hypothetical protein WD118_05165, partial [Phycisphaeraceae bacterium]